MNNPLEKAWKQFATDVGAEFIRGKFSLVHGRQHKVTAKVKSWTVTIDTYSRMAADRWSGVPVPYTRIRAVFENSDGFYFTLHRKGWLNIWRRLFGSQDVELGHPDFARDFIVQANDPVKARAIFENAKMRQIIQEQPDIELAVLDNFHGQSSPKFHQLYLRVPSLVVESHRLQALFDLFSETLNELCRLDPGTH